jgi:hypothetical protein
VRSQHFPGLGREQLERAKIGEELIIFLTSLLHLQFIMKYEKKMLCFEEIDRKCLYMWRHCGRYVEVVSMFPPNGWRHGGKCAHWVSTFIWAFLKLYLLLCKHRGKDLQYSLGIPKESPIPFGYRVAAIFPEHL